MRVTSIAKNTSFFTLALIFQKIISFSYFTILARNLAPENLGKYYFAISFTTIFAIFIDLGLANVLTREVAKLRSGKSEKNKQVIFKDDKELLSLIFSVKIPLAFLSLFACFTIINVLKYPDLTRQLVYVSAIAMVLDSFTLSFWSFMRGRQVLKYESFGVVLFQFTVLLIGLAVLKFGLGLKALFFALVFGSSSVFVFSFLLISLKFKAKIKLIYNKKQLKYLFVLSLPFGLYAVIQRLYMYLDSVLLSLLAGDKYVGLYQISFKIVFAMQFLPMAFVASLYPAFAMYFKDNKEQLALSFKRAINYLLIISLPISTGIVLLADKIMLLFKPEYLGAVFPLQIIIISLPFIFINFPIGSLLNACDKQKINTRNMGLVLLFSVALNLVLIPRFQTLGASITVLTSNFLMFILGGLAVSSIIRLSMAKLFLIISKIIIASLVMAGSVLFLKNNTPLFINIFISGIIYISMLFSLQAFSRGDVSGIIKSLRQ